MYLKVPAGLWTDLKSPGVELLQGPVRLLANLCWTFLFCPWLAETFAIKSTSDYITPARIVQDNLPILKLITLIISA